MGDETKIVAAVDVGATGIKGALVDLSKGTFVSKRVKYSTPSPATPSAIGGQVKALLKDLNWKKGVVGCGFTAIIRDGVCLSAANIDKSWLGTNAEKVMKKITGFPFHIVNDADAAGMAEMRFGNAKKVKGTVILLTLGTGIGSALFVNGILVPNTEFGHLKWKNGKIAEFYLSNRAREKYEMDLEDWAGDLNKYLIHLNKIFSPNLFLLGGGISKRFSEYKHMFSPTFNIKAAKLFNNAGIIGAAAVANP